jgi:hypothetical protein
MQLKNVREWLRDKPQPLGLLSVFLSIVQDDIYRMSADMYTGKALPGFTVAEFEQWKRLYSKPKQVVRALFAYLTFSGLDGFRYNESITSAFNAISVFATTNDPTVFEQIKLPDVPPEEFQAALYTHLFEKLEAFAFEHAKHMRDSTDADSPTSMDLSIEVVFFFRVWIECWLVHHEPFLPLFRQARNGDVDALEKLVLLDRNILYAPRIARIWARMNADNESPYFERIHRAQARQPHLVEYRAYDIKADIAGLIAKMSEAFGHTLNPSEIGQLFDALARDLAPPGQKVHRDPDINRKSDPWRKIVNRKKEKWSQSPFFSDNPAKPMPTQEEKPDKSI